MTGAISFIGFGEAATAFAAGMAGPLAAYDRKLSAPETRPGKLTDFVQHGVAAAASNAEAVAGAALILSLVTADQALAAAQDTAASIAPGALFCDMNSVAPDTKRAAAEAIGRAGGRYVDVAIMAPIHPLRRQAPLLIAGPYAEAAADRLRGIGFGQVRVVGDQIGAASAIKMIRSVMIKGIEALTAECLLAAEAAGVRDEVIASLDAGDPPRRWAERADYNLDRMIVHGGRRAEEMAEVVATLDALGTGAAMSRATVGRQRAIGQLHAAPPEGLAAKLRVLLPFVGATPFERAA